MAPKKDDETQPENPAITLTLKDLRELLGDRSQGMTPELLEAVLAKTAEISAKSMQKALKPENPFHPGISFASYPEGDLKRPRPVMPFELLWKGFPIWGELDGAVLSTWWELEQYAQLKPGTYTVSKRDGSPLRVTATAQYKPDMVTVERLIVDFEVDRDNRSMISPPFIMAYQMNHADQDHQDTYVEAMSLMLSIQLQDRKAKAQPLVAVA